MTQIKDLGKNTGEHTNPTCKCGGHCCCGANTILPTVGHLLLDETGSMASGETLTRDTFNEYFTSLKNVEQITFGVSFFSLRNGEKSVRPQLPQDSTPGNVRALTTENYQPGGSTNLYDAIGSTIRDMTLRLVSTKFKPLIVIQTDGRENSSTEFTLADIKKLVIEKQNEGWQFVFLGCGINAMVDGTQMGFHKGSTITYDMHTIKGMGQVMASNTASYAACSSEGSDDFFSNSGQTVNLVEEAEKIAEEEKKAKATTG